MEGFSEEDEVTPVDKYVMTELTQEEADIVTEIARLRGITFTEELQSLLHNAIQAAAKTYITQPDGKQTAQHPKVTK